MKNSYLKIKQKKWERLFKKLDNAHIAWLEKLAKEMKSWDLDSKEIRANIALFKAEKGEWKIKINNIWKSKLRERLEKLNKNK